MSEENQAPPSQPPALTPLQQYREEVKAGISGVNFARAVINGVAESAINEAIANAEKIVASALQKEDELKKQLNSFRPKSPGFNADRTPKPPEYKPEQMEALIKLEAEIKKGQDLINAFAGDEGGTQDQLTKLKAWADRKYNVNAPADTPGGD